MLALLLADLELALGEDLPAEREGSASQFAAAEAEGRCAGSLKRAALARKERRRTSLTISSCCSLPKALLSSSDLAAWPFETLVKTRSIWRTSSRSVSTPVRHSCTLFL